MGFMNNNGFFNDGNAFNRYTQLEGVEWKIIEHLVKSDSNHAKKLWKMLYYNTPDCLTQPDLTTKQKYSLIYRDNGDASAKKIFLMPFVDDAWTEQSARLDIYIDRITPTNYVSSVVNIGFEIVVHNKINNIYGEAEEDNPNSNPLELDENGNTIVLTKSRATTMLRCLLAELNGANINCIGTLQFNQEMSPYSNSRSYVWNNRNYFGFGFDMSVIIGCVSENSNSGW